MYNKLFKDVSIIIVTYKSKKVIFKCIENLKKFQNIFILDNSKDYILKKEIYKKNKNIKFFISKKNLGYGAGNNFLLKKVKTKYALILNPDCFIKQKLFNQIQNFLSEFKDDFSIMGSKQGASINYRLKNKKLFDCKFIRGFFILINIKKIKKVGFFDENFFLYLEEVDLCLRAKQTGYKIIGYDKLALKHLGANSSDDRYEFNNIQAWHWMWSKFYFNKKYDGFILAIIKSLNNLFSLPIKIIFRYLIFDIKKGKMYTYRLRGLWASILGMKSSFRNKE